MRVGPAVVITLVAISIVAGCGGGSKKTAQTSPHTATARSARDDAQTSLDNAVRSALNANHQLSVRVLWTNQVPASARQSTGGPALSSLQAAAATRRARRIRVRMIKDQHRVLSVRLDPSYAFATAIVADRQIVQPSNADGRPRGHAVRLAERARYELHRVGGKPRFVVWKVVLLK